MPHRCIQSITPGELLRNASPSGDLQSPTFLQMDSVDENDDPHVRGNGPVKPCRPSAWFSRTDPPNAYEPSQCAPAVSSTGANGLSRFSSPSNSKSTVASISNCGIRSIASRTFLLIASLVSSIVLRIQP